MLTNYDGSSLVVDRLCDQTGQNTAVACLYFDFAVRKEQAATDMLGSILAQVVNGTERVPGNIWPCGRKRRQLVGASRSSAIS